MAQPVKKTHIAPSFGWQNQGCRFAWRLGSGRVLRGLTLGNVRHGTVDNLAILIRATKPFQL